MEEIYAVEIRQTDEGGNRTFRENLDACLAHSKWLEFGIDLLLGARVDKKMTYREEMFLPNELSENLKAYKNRSNGQSLLGATQVLLPDRKEKEGRSGYFQPVVVFSLFLLAIVLTGFWRPSLADKLAPYLYAIAGAVGLLLLFMWIGTSHYSTKMNWNLLWANPLYVLLVGSRGRKWSAYLLIAITTLSILLVAGWVLVPQQLNVAVMPVIGILLFFNVKKP